MDAVLDAPAFAAAVERTVADGQGRGLVLVALGIEHLDRGQEALLVAAETRLARAVRPGDLVGRLGEGRLAVLAGRDDGPDGAARIAERVADRLAEPFHITGTEMEIGLRIGIATGNGDDDADGLLMRAEESMATIRH